MIWTESYRQYQFQDIGLLFKRTNVQFYRYIKDLGIEMDLSKKDQKKIYFHFLIKEFCNEIHYNKYEQLKVIFYLNTWDICDIHRKMIKKIISMFGIKIIENAFTLEEFVNKVDIRDCGTIDSLDLFLQKEIKPKSFRQIKKYLDKEGFSDLSDSYFQDIVNKMAILC